MRIVEFKAKSSDPFYLLALLELCAVIDAFVFLTSIGHIRTNFRTSLLFSEWIDNQQQKGKSK